MSMIAESKLNVKVSAWEQLIVALISKKVQGVEALFYQLSFLSLVHIEQHDN